MSRTIHHMETEATMAERVEIGNEQYAGLQRLLEPCVNGPHCGNRATTTRYNGVRNVSLCEACAAEHDEQE